MISNSVLLRASIKPIANKSPNINRHSVNMMCICCHGHCCCHEKRQAPMSVTYNQSSTPKQDVRSFLDTQAESLDDVRSLLTKYNPELCKYFCSKPPEQKAAPNSGQKPQMEKFQPPPSAVPSSNANEQGEPPKPQTPTEPIQVVPADHPQQSNELQFRRPKEPTEGDRIAEELVNRQGSTRDFPDTKFRRYYSRQCVHNYGGANINPTKGGVFHGDYMKTHNINPHTMGNKPANYETYKGAIDHAQRLSRDAELRQKELKRQLKRKAGGEQHSNGYSGLCEQKGDDHIYDAHDKKHRSKHSRAIVTQEDRNIEKNQHTNFEREQSQKNLAEKNKKNPKQKKRTEKQPQVKPEPKVAPPANIPVPAQQKVVQIIELRSAQTQTESKVAEPTKLNSHKSKRESPPIRNISQLAVNSKPQTPNDVLAQPIKKMTPLHPNGRMMPQQNQQPPIPPDNQCCRQCDHQQCICIRQMKHQIMAHAQKNPEMAQRLIAYARREGMYRNYSFQLDSLNRYPCHRNEFEKYYYDWPAYTLNPKNYNCGGHHCLQQIPYAGKGMLNGHYEYEPHHP